MEKVRITVTRLYRCSVLFELYNSTVRYLLDQSQGSAKYSHLYVPTSNIDVNFFQWNFREKTSTYRISLQNITNVLIVIFNCLFFHIVFFKSIDLEKLLLLCNKVRNLKNRLMTMHIIFVIEEEINLLDQVGFPQRRCINHLTPDETHEDTRVAWQNRK